MDPQEDYSYIIELIVHLNKKYAIGFFITPKDFDTLFRWWEKNIPLKVIKNSMDQVVQRWKKKGKRINSFSNFSYQVKKDVLLFSDLNLGEHIQDLTNGKSGDADGMNEFEKFMNEYPPALEELRHYFIKIKSSILKKTLVKKDIDILYQHLLELFKDDRELSFATKKFLKNLSDRFKNEQMKRQYQINYIVNKYRIPFMEDFNHG